MKRPASSPAAEGATDTRQRLMAAAVRCVQRLGIEGTGLNDIAHEAGCARQTVYNHFANADAVILAALLEAAHGFAQRLEAAVRQQAGPAERIIAAMLFCLEQLPREPFLQVIADPRFARLLGESLFSSDTSRAVIDGMAAICLEHAPELQPRTAELGEMMTRLLLSLLLLKGGEARDPAALRALLERWLLPPLGL